MKTTGMHYSAMRGEWLADALYTWAVLKTLIYRFVEKKYLTLYFRQEPNSYEDFNLLSA
jgi:hypothetical protein